MPAFNLIDRSTGAAYGCWTAPDLDAARDNLARSIGFAGLSAWPAGASVTSAPPAPRMGRSHEPEEMADLRAA